MQIMDEETIITLYDEESDAKSDFILEDMQEADGKVYLLISPAETAEGEDLDEDDPDEDDEEYSDTAFLFRSCDRKDSEFTVLENDQDKMYITSAMSDEEYQKAVQLFMDSDRYELEQTEGEEQ